MCYTAKASVTSWWILAMMSLFLWYRNEKYDRAISVFVFTLGLIQLIEYGIHSGSDPSQSGWALFITLWLQCLVLAIGVFIFTKTHGDTNNTYQKLAFDISSWNLFFFAIVFVIFLILSFTPGYSFSGTPGSSGHIEWYTNNGPLLGKWSWLYLIGLFLPLFTIFLFYAFADLSIAILILYGILSALYVLCNYKPEAFSSMWCYLAVGFAFLAWFLGIIPNNNCNNTCST